MVLLLCVGAAVAAFSSVTTLLEQVLCVQGYTSVRTHNPRVYVPTFAFRIQPAWAQRLSICLQDFAGLCAALFILFGVLGAAALSVYVDRTKRFTEAIKINMSLTALALIAFALVRTCSPESFL